ncbi:hypothetical protein Slin15195_G112230 [Septoria linicola]|uniref:F-box domain-containing protein n=1 Tax=Septoria linicola TaxID=215465 RepID=A0A9Q9AYT2_9PEZI|nr:hypothetical protein Slin15195_G112230 [Septoria linicola]
MAAHMPSDLSAVQRVVGTIELLEQILLCIVEDHEATSGDLRTLLVAQRVNTTWRDLIKRNAIIQFSLFFPSDPEAPPIPKHIPRRFNILALPQSPVDGDIFINFNPPQWHPVGCPEASWRKMVVTNQSPCLDIPGVPVKHPAALATKLPDGSRFRVRLLFHYGALVTRSVDEFLASAECRQIAAMEYGFGRVFPR